jgi:hypothetical protein
VHGLGVNPKDGALFIAPGCSACARAKTARGVSPSASRTRWASPWWYQTASWGSGHPDLREELPPFLGLIESRDAGGEWPALSGQGESDFHVLEAARRYVYGFGSNLRTRQPEFLVSADGGRSWQARDAPASLIHVQRRGRDVARNDGRAGTARVGIPRCASTSLGGMAVSCAARMQVAVGPARAASIRSRRPSRRLLPPISTPLAMTARSS